MTWDCMSKDLRSALEREQAKRSKAAGGADVKLSAVIRSILEKALLKPRRAAA